MRKYSLKVFFFCQFAKFIYNRLKLILIKKKITFFLKAALKDCYGGNVRIIAFMLKGLTAK